MPTKNHSDVNSVNCFEFSAILSARKPTLNDFKSKYTHGNGGDVSPLWSSRTASLSDMRPKISSVFPSTCIPDKIVKKRIATCESYRHILQNPWYIIYFEVFIPYSISLSIFGSLLNRVCYRILKKQERLVSSNNSKISFRLNKVPFLEFKECINFPRSSHLKKVRIEESL